VGREKSVVRQMRDLLEAAPVDLHFCEPDIDHNRTVTAFAGPSSAVVQALRGLCQLVMPVVNLQRHTGVHPRIGALDVLPFVPVPGGLTEPEAIELAADEARWIAEEFDVPVFLYEKAGKGTALPDLRRGGFGSLLDRELSPDFGPTRVHPHMGASVVGVRGFLIALNVNFRGTDHVVVDRIAAEVRDRRRHQLPGWNGVRALGLTLAEQGMVQVSLNVTQPDVTPVDPVVTWIRERATTLDFAFVELIGVIRDVDLPGARSVSPRSEQVVKW
jgi:glutamate formiminotransferase